MLRCLAIDDEPLALELLEDNIRSVPFLSLVAGCRNAMEAMQLVQRGAIDLIFSDIQMPGLSGLQLITSLPQRPMFILITAHEKFALESYNLDVIDYLLKPVPYERFVKACSKALEQYSLRHSAKPAEARNVSREFIFLPVDYKQLKVYLADISIVEGVKDYVRIHFSGDKQSLLVRMSMKVIEEMLGSDSFLRIHKSYIISIRHLTAVRKTSVFVGNAELPIGEAYRDAVARIAGGG